MRKKTITNSKRNKISIYEKKNTLFSVLTEGMRGFTHLNKQDQNVKFEMKIIEDLVNINCNMFVHLLEKEKEGPPQKHLF